MNNRYTYLLLLLLSLGAIGCASWGENIGNGVSTSLKNNGQDITYKLGAGAISGVRDSLTSPASELKIKLFLDSLLSHVGITTSKQLSMLLDTLAGSTTNGKIHVLLKTVRAEIDSLRDSLLGPQMTKLVHNLLQKGVLNPLDAEVKHLLSDVLGDSTNRRVGYLLDTVSHHIAMMRDTLLGGSLQSSIDTILAHSLARIEAASERQQGFIKKNATAILWTAGGIIAAIIILCAYIYIKKKKADKMLQVVTAQINQIPDKQSYDELTDRISSKSKDMGVEGDLNSFLQKQGLVASPK